MLVLVGEVAPQVVLGLQVAQSLEGQGLQSPWLECDVIVRAVLDVCLQPGTEQALVLVERRLEPARAQPATRQPGGREPVHFGKEGVGVGPGAPNSSSRRVVPRPSDSVVPSSITVPG